MTDELELSIVVLPNALPVRVPLLRVLTTIGSAPDADLRLVTVAKEWALVKREGEKFTFRQLATKTTHELLPGRPLVVDGNSEIKLLIQSRHNSPLVSCDGQDGIRAQAGDIISVRKRAQKLTLLHPRGHDFYEACRSKLGWSSKP